MTAKRYQFRKADFHSNNHMEVLNKAIDGSTEVITFENGDKIIVIAFFPEDSK